MSADVIATRRAEAVRLLRDGGREISADIIAAEPLRIFDVTDEIADVAGDEPLAPADRAALHALALLLAAMTEPT